MKLTILSFGIAKDIIGHRFYEINIADGATVSELRTFLASQFSALLELSALRIAVNSEYAGEDTELKADDEVALIPPVSGG